MKNNLVFTTEEEVANPNKNLPHLVILGAGASRAAFPRGEQGGKVLPLMSDFISVLGLENLFVKYGYDLSRQNIENVYSDLCLTQADSEFLLELESRISEYFSAMALPENPTIYDYLVLSLRPKDFIATYNWDPLLVRAVQRNGRHIPGPQLLFLHGNVAVGHCMRCKRMGLHDDLCPVCGSDYKKSPLLYPIRKKLFH